MIVAHPDDETLWGYYYLKNFDNWKILCITNSNNPTRVQELTNIAKKFNTALEIWNYQDSPHSYNMHPQIYKDIHRAINLDPNVQIVLTHNPLGEYGHIQHIKVSNVVLTVSKKPTYVFSYSSKKGEQKEKCELKNIYKSQEKIFEEHCKKIIPQKIYKLK